MAARLLADLLDPAGRLKLAELAEKLCLTDEGLHFFAANASAKRAGHYPWSTRRSVRRFHPVGELETYRPQFIAEMRKPTNKGVRTSA